METLTDVAQELDRILDGPVVIFGSLPPAARDLDVVAPGSRVRAIASHLSASGWRHRRDTWVLLRPGAPLVVDLVDVAGWRLSPEAEARFLDSAVPVEGLKNVSAPSAGHALLIMARRMAYGMRLDAKKRSRLEALDRIEGAWAEAAELAPGWRATKALADLEVAFRSGSERPARRVRFAALREMGGAGPRDTVRAARSAVPLPRRPKLVAFSGLDGSGKSTQAKALSESLEALGYDVEVAWNRLTFDPALDRIAAPVKHLLRFLTRISGAIRTVPNAENASAPAAELRARSGVMNLAWAGIVGSMNALRLRRLSRPRRGAPDVVIADRYLLDSVVELEMRYGGGERLPWHERVMRWLAPSPVAAFFLEVPAETAWERKQDEFDPETLEVHASRYSAQHARLGYWRLDGAKAPEELSAEIVLRVWEALED